MSELKKPKPEDFLWAEPYHERGEEQLRAERNYERACKELAMEALEKINRRVPIMGSTGNYRIGQLDALDACRKHSNEVLDKIRESEK